MAAAGPSGSLFPLSDRQGHVHPQVIAPRRMPQRRKAGWQPPPRLSLGQTATRCYLPYFPKAAMVAFNVSSV